MNVVMKADNEGKCLQGTYVENCEHWGNEKRVQSIREVIFGVEA